MDDRITQILQQRSAEVPRNAPMPLPSENYSPAMPWNVPQQTPMDILAKKLQQGDPQSTQLLKSTQRWTGNDHDATESALQFMIDHPDDIDPSNSYQVNTALAQWSKQSGYNAQATSRQPLTPQQTSMQDMASIASGKGTDYFGRQQDDAKNIASIGAAESLTTHRLSGGSSPASIQIANEIEKARASGDTQRVMDLMQAQKIIKLGEGMQTDGNGVTSELTNYGATSGGIKRQEASGTASGKATGDAQGNATANLGVVIDNSDRLIHQVEGVLNHPGKSRALGAMSYLPSVRGSDASDFESRLAQIGGGAFLKQYDQIRGGGAITEIEGVKATEAINRMKTAQSEDQFDQSANDFLDVIKIGKQRSILQSQGNFGADNPASTSAPTQSGGVKFLGFE